jgi:hypothetical protein
MPARRPKCSNTEPAHANCSFRAFASRSSPSDVNCSANCAAITAIAGTVEMALTLRLFGRWQWVASETQFLHHFPPNQMLLNYSFSIFRSYFLIPSPLRIDHRNRPSDADSQTLTSGSITWPIRPGDVQLLHPLLDILPRLLARLLIDTIRADTNKEVTAELAHPKLLGHSVRR